jgi:hypothetical protein
MKLSFQEKFQIPSSHSLERTVFYLQSPQLSLSEVSFIRNLEVLEEVTESGVQKTVKAELLFAVPMLGELVFPFQSRLEPTAQGAKLHALTLPSKTWAGISGVGTALSGELHYSLEVDIHIDMPAGEKWGGMAFRKMVDLTAQKSLERVGQEFPKGIALGLAKLDVLDTLA